VNSALKLCRVKTELVIEFNSYIGGQHSSSTDKFIVCLLFLTFSPYHNCSRSGMVFILTIHSSATKSLHHKPIFFRKPGSIRFNLEQRSGLHLDQNQPKLIPLNNLTEEPQHKIQQKL
jgi:hypothetical protein